MGTRKKRRKWLQAYKQAPWRNQMQFIGLFLLIVVFVALIAGVYLNVTARAATLGRQILVMREEMRELERHNADLETQLAYLTSVESMSNRAEELGYVAALPERVVYVYVPGYVGRRTAELAPAPGPVAASQTPLSAEFTQSLTDWLGDFFKRNLMTPGLTGGSHP